MKGGYLDLRIISYRCFDSVSQRLPESSCYAFDKAVAKRRSEAGRAQVWWWCRAGSLRRATLSAARSPPHLFLVASTNKVPLHAVCAQEMPDRSKLSPAGKLPNGLLPLPERAWNLGLQLRM